MTHISNILIFLADDDSDDRELFELALRETANAASLKTFEDGVSLMTALTTVDRHPDMIFLDLNMPRKSGFDCLAEIKHDKKLKNIPVIVLSTSTNPQNIDYCFKCGASFYAVKPTDFRALGKLIQKTLNNDWKAEPSKADFLLDLSGLYFRKADW